MIIQVKDQLINTDYIYRIGEVTIIAYEDCDFDIGFTIYFLQNNSVIIKYTLIELELELCYNKLEFNELSELGKSKVEVLRNSILLELNNQKPFKVFNL